jgi:putative holliday junction resolvase
MSKTILAIDYGTKRVGIAISWTSLAEPLTVLSNTQNLFDEILKLIEEHRPVTVVVGLSEQEMAKQTREFVENLKNFLAEHVQTLPLFVFTDETLSSVEVQERLHQAGKHHLKNKGPIDHYAAAQFLQDYLDLHQIDQNQ